MVKFFLEGNPVAQRGGHVWLTQPLSSVRILPSFKTNLLFTAEYLSVGFSIYSMKWTIMPRIFYQLSMMT